MKSLPKINPCWLCGRMPILKRKRRGWVKETMLHICPKLEEGGNEFSIGGDTVEKAVMYWNRDVAQMKKEWPKEEQLKLIFMNHVGTYLIRGGKEHVI